MKKLLIILALALSANAWAEFKTLDCKSMREGASKTYFQRITFDPELPDAEKQDCDGECGKDGETIPVKVKVFPSYYRFVWSGDDNFSIKTLDLSRKDLTYTKKIAIPKYPHLNSEGFGKCELVEIDTSENIL